MDFEYYFIIQDVVGVLIGLLGLKLSIIYSMLIFRKEASSKNILCLIGNIMLIISGAILVVSDFNLQAWLVSIMFIMLSWIFGRLTYRKPSSS